MARHAQHLAPQHPYGDGTTRPNKHPPCPDKQHVFPPWLPSQGWATFPGNTRETDSTHVWWPHSCIPYRAWDSVLTGEQRARGAAAAAPQRKHPAMETRPKPRPTNLCQFTHFSLQYFNKINPIYITSIAFYFRTFQFTSLHNISFNFAYFTYTSAVFQGPNFQQLFILCTAGKYWIWTEAFTQNHNHIRSTAECRRIWVVAFAAGGDHKE